MGFMKIDRIIEKRSRVNKKVVCFSSDTWSSALCEVRLRAPLEAAGFQVIQGNDYQKRLVETLIGVDYVVIQRDFPRYIDFFFNILEETKRHKIPLIYEIDDLLFNLPENHPLQQTGCYSNRLMPMLTAIYKADLVTASTEPLAVFLRSFNSNVQVLPNYLIDNYWNFSPVKEIKKQEDHIVIGYIGGHTHASDLTMIIKALMVIGQQFGHQVSLKFWGVEPPEELLSHFRVEWQPPVASYEEYALTFRNQDIDILIAPLENNSFTQSKSHLKFLEYSTLGVPGVYSKVTPYEEIVKHGKNGFLASSDQEWIECLQTLIAFPDMRQQIARKAQETVRKNQLLSDHANKWSKAYAKIGIESSGSQIFIGDLLNVQDAILQKIYSSQNAQSDRSQIQIEDKERLIQTLTAELEDKDRILQSVINSKSWALTKPLRFVGRKIKKTRKILSKDN
jgi:glycosyltransferase involved in cell wall biosynthesis